MELLDTKYRISVRSHSPVFAWIYSENPRQPSTSNLEFDPQSSRMRWNCSWI